MEAKISALISTWITQNKPSVRDVRPDQNLLDSGIIDSLDYLNIVEYVSAELGVEVDIAEFEEASLSTISGMAHEIAKQIPA